MKSVYLLSLGCPRNLTESEVLLASLEKKGFSVTEAAEKAEVAIVNTCGFIDDAKQESIDMVLHLVEMKKEGALKRIIVCGCLSQRYPEELVKEIREIDGIFGAADLVSIPDMIDRILAGEKISKVSSSPGPSFDHAAERKLLTPPHYAYLKIQEGCSNRCSYCVIPFIKGAHRSRTIDSVLREARSLKDKYDMKELVLIGQDITSFGSEREGGSDLAVLLKKLSPVMKDGWIRMLYAHPAHFTDELIDVMAGTGNICRYVDLPIQHINDRILEAMNRRVTRREIEDLLGRIRKRIEEVALRTSVIVGFPGETDGEFDELLKFLEDVRFERLGAFIYSREEGTPAAAIKEQVPEDVKRERFDAVMSLQREISGGNNFKLLGRSYKVLIDEEGRPGEGSFVGRTEMDAPEVDGVVYVRGNAKLHDFCDVKITGTMEYDLVGEVA